MRTPGRLSDSPWARVRWAVLAPHPDDETLGAGALIAEAARRRMLAGVAFLTWGEGSHPGGGRDLAKVRKAEAELALRRLAGGRVRHLGLGWRDAAPLSPHERRYGEDARRFGAWLRRNRVQALAVTAGGEPHCDHAAAFGFAHAAAKASGFRIAVFQYFVWSAPDDGGVRRLRTWSMDPRARRYALAAHRSQLTPRHGVGFRLPPARLRMAAFDVLVAP